MEILTYLEKLNWELFGTAITIIGSAYALLRNFKADIKADINGHIDRLEKRMDAFDIKVISLEERIFFLATGKTLAQAILDEKMKIKEKK